MRTFVLIVLCVLAGCSEPPPKPPPAPDKLRSLNQGLLFDPRIAVLPDSSGAYVVTSDGVFLIKGTEATRVVEVAVPAAPK